MEFRWSNLPPPGSLPANSNSIIREVNGAVGEWFYAGGFPGVYATRISGATAAPWGAGGYPNPNFTVYDLRDNSVLAGSTYSYKAKYRPETSSSNTYSVLINEANCGGPAPVTCPAGTTLVGMTNSVPPNPICSPIVTDGRIDGYCTWVNNEPVVNVVWSQNPPPNQGAATINQLHKGDCFINDPNTYWCPVPNGPTEYSYADDTVLVDTQYQYRVKYRSDLWSENTYSIYTSSRNCGVPAPKAGPVSLSPTYQTVPPNVTALVSATGGDGSFTWSAPTGVITGSGPNIGVIYTNDLTTPVTKTITVTSGGQTATATVLVNGIETYRDDITLTGRGARYVSINNDAAIASSSGVVLTLGHGFSGVATSSVTMKLGNTQTALAAAVDTPFEKFHRWDLCDGLALCGDGMYTVYAQFRNASEALSSAVLDSIVYLINAKQDASSVTINNGDTSTVDRLVTLVLRHDLASVSDDEVTMQIANKPELVDGATAILYSPSISGWDMCAGLGSVCDNGVRTVYVKFCARGICSAVVKDEILLQSPWQPWGVIINNNDAATSTADVELTLNPWFEHPRTEVFISNLPDFSIVSTGSYASLVSWNLCAGLATCGEGDRTVYVRYQNTDLTAQWPGPQSPDYQDGIAMGPTPTPTATPLPAGIYINDGAQRSTSRIVTLTFASPFGSGPTVTMRHANEAALSARDREIISTRGGGIIAPTSVDVKNVSPTPVPPANRLITPVPSVTDTIQNRTLFADAVSIPELDSVTARAFQARITGWDLCEGASQCPYGVYKVFVQYYRASGVVGVSTTRAALGDEVSDIYADSIEYAAPTPTPTLTPTPSTSVTPSPTTEPSESPLPPDPLPDWFPTSIASLSEALAGSETIFRQISIASTVAVGTSAAIALIPILGSSGAASFMWQGLMAMLGLLPKRKKVWGTVYDARTKRPIPFAKVQLLDRNRRVLETHIADKDGRYGFLTTPESLMAQNVQIMIQPSANNYAFPAHTAASVDAFVYNNLYYGDLITVSDQKLINYDIPMDPLRPSAAPLVVTSPSIVLGASVAAIADAGFWLGLVIIPLNAVLMPSPFTFGVLFLFLGTASLRMWGIQEHPFGTVRDGATGHPMPFALITLNDLSGKRVGFTVTDERGRYFLVAGKGTYEMTIFTPATVIPARQSKQVIEAHKGWITRELTL